MSSEDDSSDFDNEISIVSAASSGLAGSNDSEEEEEDSSEDDDEFLSLKSYAHLLYISSTLFLYI